MQTLQLRKPDVTLVPLTQRMSAEWAHIMNNVSAGAHRFNSLIT
jgi:hypothetical protein